jgi:hypothetical protein
MNTGEFLSILFICISIILSTIAFWKEEYDARWSSLFGWIVALIWCLSKVFGW